MTTYRQILPPNVNATAKAGYCLVMQRNVFNVPALYKDAWTAWTNAKYKHETREMPSVAVTLFFSWTNQDKTDPNYKKNQGHTVAWIPSKGKFLSSPGTGTGQKWFDSIVAVENYFSAKYVGWTQDFNGKQIVEVIVQTAPAPTAPILNIGQGSDYYLDVEVDGFVTASDAVSHTNSNSRVPAGNYKVFNKSKGMVNITPDASKPGWWIDPADDVVPIAAPALTPQGFSVGDTVVPMNLVDYNGTHLKSWDATYTITQLVGDRAVLSARGVVWAALNTANIRKA